MFAAGWEFDSPRLHLGNNAHTTRRREVNMRIASAVIVVLVITLMAASFAQAQSCFSLVAQAGGKPGQGVSEVASGAAVPGTPGSGTDELAREVGVVNQVRSDLCPAAP